MIIDVSKYRVFIAYNNMMSSVCQIKEIINDW
jgi:hypothetical protein